MRILFISRWFPYPPDNGSRIRVYNLIKQLARRHEITLLSFAEWAVSGERLAKMETLCRSVHVVPYREFRPGRLKALLGLFSVRPRSIVDTYSLEMQALVEEISEQSSFDVVVLSEIGSALYGLLVKQIPRVFEDIELAVPYEQFTHQRTLFSTIRRGLTWWKLSRFVVRLLSEFEGCTVVSERERDLVTRIAPAYGALAVVPNGVDLEAYTGDFGAPVAETMIYPGALTYRANCDAVEFFAREVLPLIMAERPDAILRVTGKYDGVPVERLPLGGGVELTGYLDSIQPAVAQSWVCVVPLRVGGGTRLKILEAMALGTPVVSTSKGAEGLAVTHGENILVADQPQVFAQAVLRLFGDGSLRARLAKNGRRLVEERYSWESCAGQLEQLLCRVTEIGLLDG